jgi:hypothetical protein
LLVIAHTNKIGFLYSQASGLKALLQKLLKL